MLGTEQAVLESSWVRSLFYRVFGNAHMGERIRAANVRKALRSNDLSGCAILDAGCGTGVLSFDLAQKFPEARIVSIDLDSKLIQRTKIVIAKRKIKNVNFDFKDILHLDKTELFNLIMFIDLLEHIEDDVKAIRNMSNSMKKGGILILHVPQKFQRHPVRSMEWKGHHVREGYTIQEIVKLLEGENLQISKIWNTFGVYGAIADEIEYLLWKIKPIWLLSLPFLLLFAWFDILFKHSRGNGLLIKAMKAQITLQEKQDVGQS